MKEPEALLSVIVPVFNERETVQEILRRITAVELKHRRLHDLRHTYASLLLSDGATMPTCPK